jgi:hypothetical protein
MIDQAYYSFGQVLLMPDRSNQGPHLHRQPAASDVRRTNIANVNQNKADHDDGQTEGIQAHKASPIWLNASKQRFGFEI